MRAGVTLSPNALAVLRQRYLAPRGSESEEAAETPHDMFLRVAEAVAAPEAGYAKHGQDGEVQALAERFYDRMTHLEFLPNSPTLMNAGRDLGQLAACFVVPVEDSTAGIFRAIQWAAEIQKTGGGTGFSFSALRPAGDRVESTGGLASGPVAFMRVFDSATAAIKQGGVRRGANMGILGVDHPDILDFIGIKLDATEMRNFNLSVAVTEEFMAAVERGAAYTLTNPRTGRAVRELDARRVFDAIANAAWACGDPGLIFIDRINEDNPTPRLGSITATNPCGEQPLLPFESCTLGSVNLGRFARGGTAPTVDWDGLGEVVRDAVRFLDNVVDANRYPLEQIARATRATRKIGLGVMGFADFLIELGVPYESERAVELASQVAAFLDRESLRASASLAEQRGAFPAWSKSRWAERGMALRNATTTTIAPTGTISIIAGCSSGIEPLFALAYERHVLDGAVLTEFHEGFRRHAERQGFWSDELADNLLARGSVGENPAVPETTRLLYATAHDVSPEQHLRVQAAFQQHVHAGVSKTVNLPFDAQPSDIADIYTLAHRLRCKGVTVYRDRSLSAQVLSMGVGAAAQADDSGASCPACGAALGVRGACSLCRVCGWSGCE